MESRLGSLEAFRISAAQTGCLIEKYPRIKNGRVIDGRHRIAYYLVRGMPCIAKVIQ